MLIFPGASLALLTPNTRLPRPMYKRTLTATAATGGRLLDALLAETLVPTEDRELEAAE